MQKTFQLPELGLKVQLGKFACQADGSVLISSGNTVVLSTVVASKEPKEFMGFFPLTVEYRERSSASGKFPGGYIKREGRLSDIEVLTCRLIDRPIRPLFPSHYFNEVQLLSSVYSADGDSPTGVLAIIGSSLALTISSIPFLGPIGAVQAFKVDGKWKFNLGYNGSFALDSEITIAGTKDGICMVEGYCNNLSEHELIDLMFESHEQIKKQIDWQLEIQKEVGKEKAPIEELINWDEWNKKVKDFLPTNFVDVFFVGTRLERKLAVTKLRYDLIENFSKNIEDKHITKSLLLYIFDSLLKEVLPEKISKKGIRTDGRRLDQIRSISSETAILPCAHGSAVFRRGETQALASLTLGTCQDAQKVDVLVGDVIEKNFMLHYNFPPFATGEIRMMRGVGRREIGHGYLAENSFRNVLPPREQFPYTIRSVVDILESNGSSSMATVCATTMALLDGGVPIKDMVSGIAMGLLKDNGGDFHVLTDILGMEDSFGLMDFKITGTENGIMSVQMDIKEKAGLNREILEKALEQAKIARLSILNEMKKVMTVPRPKLSDLAPRVVLFKIDSERIGSVIGPAGRTIKEIIAQTGTKIDIEDDGSVMVYSKDVEPAKVAEKWIKILAGDIEIGSIFHGIVRRIVDFGIFVELIPGKDGLIHVSKIAKGKQRDIDKICKVGTPLKVKVLSFDRESGRINLESEELK